MHLFKTDILSLSGMAAKDNPNLNGCEYYYIVGNTLASDFYFLHLKVTS